jgi:hypothetical protein
LAGKAALAVTGDISATLAAIDKRLRRLEAIEAIKGVIARYTDGADKRNDPAIMGPLFHDDAVWEADGFGAHRGAATIAAALAEIARAQITWSIHYMVLPTVTVESDGRQASCQWYLWELAKIRNADGETHDSWFAAKYNSTLIKDEAGWRFTWLKLNPLLNVPVGAPWPTPASAAFEI